MKCRTKEKNTRCNDTKIMSTADNSCAAFEVCLGAGRVLTFNGRCFSVQGSSSIPDGWYSEVQIVNGCIVAAKERDVPTYTPPPCAPAPGACGDNSTGVPTLPPLSPDICNLITNTGGELLAALQVQAGEGVTISGCGTQTSPLIISAETSDTAIYINSSTPSVLRVTGSGTLADAYQIGLVTSPLAAGQYGAYTVDMYGRIVGYDATANDGIQAVSPGRGVDVQTISSGVVQISTTDTGVQEGTYLTGGYETSVAADGRITGYRQAIEIAAGAYQLGDYTVTLNSQGSVTSITTAPLGLSSQKFVAMFRSDAGTERVMSFTTDVDSQFYIIYKGMFAPAQPGAGHGIQFTDNLLRITIDGVAMTGGAVEYMPDGTAGLPVAYYVLTAGVFPAGEHEVQFITPDGTHNAVVTVELVEGA